MGDILKILGKGALTIIMLPFIAAYFAVILIVALFNHLVHEIITVVHYFKGQNITFKDDLQIRYENIVAAREAQAQRETYEAYSRQESIGDQNDF